MSNKPKIKKKKESKEPCVFCTLKGIAEQLLIIGEYLMQLAQNPAAVKEEENKTIVGTIGKDLEDLSEIIRDGADILTMVYQEEHNTPHLH